ncbi:MAG: bifunctional pyr operon transcriptional regulator/uracil phosphoribosyltransferase PyrR [Leptospirillum sp.]
MDSFSSPPSPARPEESVSSRKILLDAEQIDRMIRRMAHEILERNQGSRDLYLIGILQGGGALARRLVSSLQSIEGSPVSLGTVDITLYRDDLSTKPSPPFLKESLLPESVDHKKIVLVDDVLYTGRSVRCALDLLMDLGRPTLVQLAVLIDRGHRELPIRADFVGKNIPTGRDEVVEVSLETNRESVALLRKETGKGTV